MHGGLTVQKNCCQKASNCPHCGHDEFKKETDIMDVWFDSGSSWAGVLEVNDLDVPCAMYLEGSDQHRGWFNSSLLTAVATTGKAPYNSVLTHGFVVDGEGRKMSKSVGNTVAPSDIIDVYGADVKRLWYLLRIPSRRTFVQRHRKTIIRSIP